jgi:hypothetical protein
VFGGDIAITSATAASSRIIELLRVETALPLIERLLLS